MKDDQRPYTGPERRHGPRRVNTDRRELVRFQIDKNPRRSCKDRRKQDIWEDRDKF